MKNVIREITLRTRTLSEDLQKQLFLLINTPLGTCVLYRDFGLDLSCLDNPLPLARNLLAAELVVKLDRYIPALRLVEVDLVLTDEETDGILNLVLEVEYAG